MFVLCIFLIGLFRSYEYPTLRHIIHTEVFAEPGIFIKFFH